MDTNEETFRVALSVAMGQIVVMREALKAHDSHSCECALCLKLGEANLKLNKVGWELAKSGWPEDA